MKEDEPLSSLRAQALQYNWTGSDIGRPRSPSSSIPCFKYSPVQGTSCTEPALETRIPTRGWHRSNAAVCKATNTEAQRRLLLDVVGRMSFPLCLTPLESTKKPTRWMKKRLKKNPPDKEWPLWHLQFLGCSVLDGSGGDSVSWSQSDLRIEGYLGSF